MGTLVGRADVEVDPVADPELAGDFEGRVEPDPAPPPAAPAVMDTDGHTVEDKLAVAREEED